MNKSVCLSLVISVGQILGIRLMESKVMQTCKSLVITFKFIFTGYAVYGRAQFIALYLNNYILMRKNGILSLLLLLL